MEEKIVTILNEMAEYLTVPQMKKSDRVSRRSCSMRLFCKLAIKTI